jgi:hypothetical protein
MVEPGQDRGQECQDMTATSRELWARVSSSQGLVTVQNNNNKTQLMGNVFKIKRCGSPLLTSNRKD